MASVETVILITPRASVEQAKAFHRVNEGHLRATRAQRPSPACPLESATNFGWRRWLSSVHSRYSITATSCGFSQRHLFMSSAVKRLAPSTFSSFGKIPKRAFGDRETPELREYHPTRSWREAAPNSSPPALKSGLLS